MVIWKVTNISFFIKEGLVESRDIIKKDHIYHTKQYQTFYRKVKCDF